ncbi:DUF2231 domain-containing protein [Hamadaea tsunoensis]|uniref:DUF2231 domain-containing protein n=1 Tax=Hamadaea tsunoensis TaxID=53368 RepID=UPI00041CF1F7|nr:DUF2231 domain-containing protein [Hamadaea tsunoensis]
MTTINGLPAHILLVHAIVVLLPLSAVLVLLTAVWPAARARLALSNLVLSLVTLALVPLTTDAGEWLIARVPRSAALHEHAQAGENAIYAAIPVAVVAAVIFARTREWGAKILAPSSTVVTAVVMVLATLAAGGACYDIYLIGDSGARAAWVGKYSSEPHPRKS